MRSRHLSSNTEHRGERGQAIVIFSIWLFLLLIVAAAAFDVGQSMLDRRNQQDSADAAALAGARYLPGAANYQGPCASVPGGNLAAVNACAQAATNGFVDGSNNTVVNVSIPPGPTSIFSNLPGYIQVSIGSTRPSIFGGRMLPSSWTVNAMGVAKNGADAAAPYSFLALNKTQCPSVLLSGQGHVVAGGDIQINTSCLTGGLQTTGSSSIDVTSPSGTIKVVGDWASGGGATVSPMPLENQPWQPDPLAELPAPALPAAPNPVVRVSGSGSPPAACPGGSSPATAAAPATCQFPSSYAGSVWRLFPGYYPGGLKFQGGTFYLEPGIYYLGGGGLDANGTGATIYSVDASGTAPPMGGGVLLYNTEDAVFHTQCAANPTFNAGCLGAIKLNGSSAPIFLRGMQSGDYQGIVIFQDRNLSIHDPATNASAGSADLQLNGSATTLNVEGTVYIPRGLVQANGSGGTASTSQFIVDQFKATGSNANLIATYSGDSFYKPKGVGLVE